MFCFGGFFFLGFFCFFFRYRISLFFSPTFFFLLRCPEPSLAACASHSRQSYLSSTCTSFCPSFPAVPSCLVLLSIIYVAYMVIRRVSVSCSMEGAFFQINPIAAILSHCAELVRYCCGLSTALRLHHYASFVSRQKATHAGLNRRSTGGNPNARLAKSACSSSHSIYTRIVH